jgi:hypothetical protein
VEDVLQQPVARFVVEEHEEELDQFRKVARAEELADEAELAVVNDEPRILARKLRDLFPEGVCVL